MSHSALKRFTYFGQLGILGGLIGGGLILAVLVSFIPFLTNPELRGLVGSSPDKITEKLLVPENANILRVVQLLSTFCLFFLPTVLYAKICHKRAFMHLGYAKPISFPQIVVAISIMLACVPLSGLLSQLFEMLPFPDAWMQKFKQAEEDYAKQINVIGRMDNFGDYLVSLFMLAILPALFEETLFRGGLQNLLTRWFKLPLLAIIVTSIIFSAVHFSYLGFISRVALGFVLGWMYYRTGNLWPSIIGHAIYNGTAITVLYVMKLNNPKIDVNTADPQLPIWIGVLGLVVTILLLYAFEWVSKYQVNEPGKELVMQDEMNNPFAT
jgi:CAAX protease family protein